MPKKLNESPIEYHDRLLSLDQDAVDDLSDEEAALHRKLRKQKKEAERKAEEERKAEGERQKAKAARRKKKAEAEEAKRKEEAAKKRSRSVEDDEEKDDGDASRPLMKKAKSEFASKVCHSLGGLDRANYPLVRQLSQVRRTVPASDLGQRHGLCKVRRPESEVQPEYGQGGVRVNVCWGPR